MAIYGVGAYHDDHDVSQDFIARSLAGVGWSEEEAPELHRFYCVLEGWGHHLHQGGTVGEFGYHRSCHRLRQRQHFA